MEGRYIQEVMGRKQKWHPFPTADQHGDVSIAAMLQLLEAQKPTSDSFSVLVWSAIYLMTGLV